MDGAGAYEVAPGVHRIPLPLPNDGLRAVNVYAVADGDELVLVDSGWALDEARDQLEQALGSIGHGFESISRFLVTHVHRDHYTLGITLRRMFGSRVSLGIGEQPSLEAILHGRVEGQLNDLVRWGAEDIAERMRQGMKKGGPRQDGYEQPDEWIRGATDIRLETRTLRALPTRGTRRATWYSWTPTRRCFSPVTTSSRTSRRRSASSWSGRNCRSATTWTRCGWSASTRRCGCCRRTARSPTPPTSAWTSCSTTTAAAWTRRNTPSLRTRRRRPRWRPGWGWTRHNRKLSEMDIFNRMLAIGETSAHLTCSSGTDGCGRPQWTESRAIAPSPWWR
ncbi:hypothetical protein GCM10018954_095630 [Kutzneria kofuensis]